MNIPGTELGFWSKRALIASSVTVGAYYFSVLENLTSADLNNVAAVVAQIAATMLGFVLAALAVLTTIADTRLVRNMKKTGHYHVLVLRLQGTVAAFGIVCVVGIALLFVPGRHLLFRYVLVAAIIFSALLLFDAIRKFWIVLYHLAPPPETEDALRPKTQSDELD